MRTSTVLFLFIFVQLAGCKSESTNIDSLKTGKYKTVLKDSDISSIAVRNDSLQIELTEGIRDTFYINWKNDFEKFRKLWKHSSPEELKNYLSVFRRKYSLTAAINYYRANFRKGKMEPIGDISIPTLFIWGKNDFAIGKVAAENNHKYMKGYYTFLELDGGHWLIQTNYLEVEQAIIEHLTKNKTALNNVYNN